MLDGIFSILGRIRKIMIESIFEIDDIFGQEWKMMIYCFGPSLTFYPEIAREFIKLNFFLLLNIPSAIQYLFTHFEFL